MQRSEPMLHQSRGGGGRPHEGHAQAGESYRDGMSSQARRTRGGAEVGLGLPPKMTPAQIAEAQRMAREWKRLGAPGKSRSVRVGRTCGSKGRSFARLRSPLALLMKLAVALAQPVQSRF